MLTISTEAISMSKTKQCDIRLADDLFWLSQVREVKIHLDDAHPVFVREVSVLSGDRARQPTVPFPERHPYFEFNINLNGLLTQLVCGEKFERQTGDIMFLAPGIPHYAFRHSYPHRTITVYFLPLMLLELGPNGDGAWLLSRFTRPSTIAERVIRPPVKLRQQVTERAIAMIREFANPVPGAELRLRSLLAESLVSLARWELSIDKGMDAQPSSQDWAYLEKALRYLHIHYAEPLYIDQVAGAIGVTANRLRNLFRQTLGMSCSHYLHSLRIAQAKSRLCLPNTQVTEVALNVGFETLSHFNTSFRKLTGMSPTQYVRSVSR
jgi:AraC-like DNA-binding protein